MARTSLTERQCERLVSARTGISGDTLRDLLRSEEGFSFLEALMGDDPPAWWEGFRYNVLAAETRAEIEAARERLKAARRHGKGHAPRRT